MIDTHAHALPEFQTLPAMGSVHRVVARISNRMAPPSVMLDIESLATLEAVLPKRGFTLLEEVSQLALLPVALAGGTLSGLLTSMNRHGIERSVLIGARGRVSNQWILKVAWPQAPDRLVPVTTLPQLPLESSFEAWLDAYRKLAEAGAAGFKMHPNWDGVLPGHPSYDAAFRIADEYDRFIVIHTGCFHVRTYRLSAPLDLGELRPYLDRFSDVRVCLAHMNRHQPEKVWELQREYEQVYTDTSWQPSRVIRRAINKVGSDRLMLGSDWPLLHLGLQHDAVSVAERATSGGHLQNIVVEAPRRFIGGST